MSIVRWEMFQQPLDTFAAQAATNVLQELARSWLTDKCKQLASEVDGNDYWRQPAMLPSRMGACWVLVVNPDRRTHELLRPYFLFPLIWLPNQSDDSRLPKGLVELADDVRTALARDRAVGDRSCGLHCYFESEPWNPTRENHGMDYPDFSQLAPELFDFSSGWASLAGSLLAAAGQKLPSTNVWATGCWNSETGITGVGGLDKKLAAADEYFSALPSGGDTFVVVPSDNLIDANRLRAERRYRFNIVAFPAGQNQPRVALGQYLALLKVRPPKQASVVDHVAYYKGILQDDRNVAENYYQAVLYPLVVEECRRSLQIDGAMPTHLVTVVSPNNELVRLAIEVFGIKECLLLYTVPCDDSEYTRRITDMTRVSERTAEDCCKLNCTPHLAPFSYDAEKANFRQKLAAIFRQAFDENFSNIAPELVAFDMISAHKIFNYACDHAVARPGNLMYWVDHQWFPAFRTPHPMTERFVVWRAGSDWISNDSA